MMSRACVAQDTSSRCRMEKTRRKLLRRLLDTEQYARFRVRALRSTSRNRTNTVIPLIARRREKFSEVSGACVRAEPSSCSEMWRRQGKTKMHSDGHGFGRQRRAPGWWTRYWILPIFFLKNDKKRKKRENQGPPGRGLQKLDRFRGESR